MNKHKQWILENILLLAFVFSMLMHLMVMPVNLSLKELISVNIEDNVMKVKLVTKKSLSNPQQIVNTEEANNDRTPEEAKFLGKKNQMFDRQTKAANVGSFKQAGQGVKNGFQLQKYKKMAEVKKQQKKKVEKKAVKKDFSKALKKIKMSDLAMDAKKDMKVKKAAPTPTMAALGLQNGNHQSTGLSASSDFVEDLPLGDMSHLNTQEYKYFGFFDRIRKKLEQHWGYSLRKKARSMMNRGVRIPASENKITSLKITIDSLGNIVEVLVKSTSGVSELDDAAIESFNKAGPFPNPPKGMIVNGQATIEWGFVVKG